MGLLQLTADGDVNDVAAGAVNFSKRNNRAW